MWTRSRRSFPDAPLARWLPASASCALLLLVASGAGQPAGPTPGAPSTDTIAELAREITENGAYQNELPDRTDTPQREAPWLHTLRPLLRLLFWAVVIAAGLLLAGWLATELGRRRWAGRSASAGGAPADRYDGVPFGAVPDPRSLAEQGRFAEAIHALLLLAIRRLARRSAARDEPSLTSRELLGRLRLDERARSGLAELVRAVEISRFGGAEVGSADYMLCRERFRQATGEEPT